jgi:hypothetical protein
MIESTEFAQIRKDLVDNDVISKRITLDNIDVTEEDIKIGSVTIYGKRVSVAPSFFRKLAMLINVNSSLASQFINNNDERIFALLVNAIKKYKTIKRDDEKDVFMLIADPASRCIIDIVKDKGGRMSMSSLCDVTERILNDHPYMNLETVDGRGGNVSFNFINGNEVCFPEAGPDEAFKFGFSLNTTPTTTSLGLYNHRMVCTNGMTVNLGKGEISDANKFDEKFTMRSFGTDNLEKFFAKLKRFQDTGFQPAQFSSQLLSATKTKASLAEVELALQQCYDAVDPKGMDTALLNQCFAKMAKEYFPGYGLTMSRVDKKGYDVKIMSDKQKSYIKTGMSIWDVVNSCTFLGSNNTPYNLYDDHKSGLKRIGGNLFAKSQKDGYDLQFANYAAL